MFKNLVDELEKQVLNLSPESRYILGIAGIPGAGKSTLAETLVRNLNERFSPLAPAIVVPMDGFHRSNETLDEMKLLHLKGVPASFDAEQFVQLLQTLRSNTKSQIFAPVFDRGSESSIAGGIVIKPEHTLCVVEGNYLLLPEAPWAEGRQCFDQVWFLDVDIETVYPRLLSRHMLVKSEQDARVKIESTDLPNASLILSSKSRADKLIETDAEPAS